MRRSSLFVFLSLSLALISAVRMQAELVWSPGQGWRIEGGALAGMSTADTGNALDLMNSARRAEEAGNSRKAIGLYVKTSTKYPNSVYGAEALYRIALLREKRREYYKSFDSLQELVKRYPNSEKFTQVIGNQYRIASGLLDGKRAYMWGIIPGLRNREKAIEYFETIVYNAPFSDYAPLSLMNVARGHQRMGSSEEAIDALDRMINSYPGNVLTPDAYLKLAQTHAALVDGAYYDQASTKAAITYYEDFLIQFPGDSGAGAAEDGRAEMKTMLAQSKMLIANYYYKYRRNYKAAKVFYNEAITTYPDSPVAARARVMLVDVEARIAGQTPPPVPDEPKAPSVKNKKRFWLF